MNVALDRAAKAAMEACEANYVDPRPDYTMVCVDGDTSFVPIAREALLAFLTTPYLAEAVKTALAELHADDNIYSLASMWNDEADATLKALRAVAAYGPTPDLGPVSGGEGETT